MFSCISDQFPCGVEGAWLSVAKQMDAAGILKFSHDGLTFHQYVF